ncbi:MAG: hypothetical protein RL612_933 [Actinomycetota bacterium]|jgi:proteic killer suppression protein
MIVSFADRNTEMLWVKRTSKALPHDVHERALSKLNILDSAVVLEDLGQPPGNHLKALSGNRNGQFSIRINQKWRICFYWTDAGPADVEIVDYH